MYSVTYSCGHSGNVEIEGTEKQINSKLKWYETSAVCPTCYRMRKEDERSKEPRILHMLPSPDIDETIGDVKVILWATGNILPIKDKFKDVGFKWGMLTDIQYMHITNAPKVWYIEGARSHMRELAKQLRDSGNVIDVINHEKTTRGKNNTAAANAKLEALQQRNTHGVVSTGTVAPAPTMTVKANDCPPVDTEAALAALSALPSASAGGAATVVTLPNLEVSSMGGKLPDNAPTPDAIVALPSFKMDLPTCVRDIPDWNRQVYICATPYILKAEKIYFLTLEDRDEFKKYATSLQDYSLQLQHTGASLLAYLMRC